jgi:ribosomal protein S18 acetylase RimI-like enzyme
MLGDIRSARADELDAVLAFWRLATEVPSSTDDLAGLSALMARDPGALVVASEDGAIIGTLIAGWDGWRGAFYRVGVHPEYRGRGIGRALVREGEARLTSRGCRRLSLFAVAAHQGAVAFWTALGYQPDPDEVRFTKNMGGPLPG